MDTSQTDDSVVLTNDPLDVVEHVLTAENLPFDRTEDGDLAFTLAGGLGQAHGGRAELGDLVEEWVLRLHSCLLLPENRRVLGVYMALRGMKANGFSSKSLS